MGRRTSRESTDALPRIAEALGAEGVSRVTPIQALWGGYGKLFRAELVGGEHFSVVVKHICLPRPGKHPRGWNTDRSHQRKLRSYRVELNWYERYAGVHAGRPDGACPMPRCLYVERRADEILLVLEDLATLGYSRVLEQANPREIRSCLRWLAAFHARHLGKSPEGLWKTGTYWHLDTRPDELAALDDAALKAAAPRVDAALKQCPFQTLVHGDAKLANFVFAPGGERVAAVDFQYVGRGCGIKDVMMLLSSTVPPDDCARRCPGYLDDYFGELKRAVAERNLESLDSPVAFEPLEQAWRAMYPVAWADFQRFLKGWSPGHWKLHAYSEELTRRVIGEL